MSAGLDVVRYNHAHREQVLRLQQHMWSRDPSLRQKYFAWKYEENPYLPAPVICLALHRGEVVGMRGIVGAKWRIGTSGGERVIPAADDLVIAPEYRGQGLASSLVRAACAYARDLGYPFVLSLRAGPLTLLDSLAAGFRSLGAMEPVGRVRLPEAPTLHRARRLLHRTPILWRWADSPWLQATTDRRPFRFLDRHEGPDSRPGEEVRVVRAADPEAMAEMVARLPPEDRVGHVRDRRYFDWVFRNPRLEYRILYWRAARLEGYLVLHRERPARVWPATVWISAWEGTSEGVCRDLLAYAVKRGRFTRLATWTATLSRPAQTLLHQHGFEPIELEARARGRPAALIWSAEGSDPDGEWAVEGRRLTDLKRWRFHPLDQD